VRTYRAAITGFSGRSVMNAVSLDEFAAAWTPERRWLLRADSIDELRTVQNLTLQGIQDLGIWTTRDDVAAAATLPACRLPGDALASGDVIAVDPESRRVHVLMRESDAHHTVFLTNRCNSQCLMCSQPPSAHDDSWLIQQALDVASHLRTAPSIIGFTGGEPLILGAQLRHVLDNYRSRFPVTQFDVLTNGRLLSNPSLAATLLKGLDRATWMVPLYGHADFLHDYVVQSHGAFDQTISGLLELKSYGQPVQLRIVLIRPVLEHLRELCWFITMNLPFVREIALMGCEPTGFALANKSLCELDISDWTRELERAVDVLVAARLRPVLMNLPLCALSPNVRRYAHRSISDWKQTYAEECNACAAKSDCCGLFAWHTKGWKPTKLRAILEEA
jgi:His-Xaa-Ser system radical SAM maturase HxsC